MSSIYELKIIDKFKEIVKRERQKRRRREGIMIVWNAYGTYTTSLYYYAKMTVHLMQYVP